MKQAAFALRHRAVQALFFLITGQWLVMGFLRCPYGVPFVSCATCPLADCSGRFLFLPFAILALGGAVLAGRVFCGWVCPLGFLQDAVGLIRRQRAVPAGPVRMRLRQIARFVALAVWVWLIFRYNYPTERAHAYVVRAPTVWNWEAVESAWALGLRRYPVRAALLAVALLGALGLPRLWCRWLCPVGALLSLGNRLAPAGMGIRRKRCTDCGACRRVCSVDAMPGSLDCIACAECTPVCPEDAIQSLGRRQEKVGEDAASGKTCAQPPV